MQAAQTTHWLSSYLARHSVTACDCAVILDVCIRLIGCHSSAASRGAHSTRQHHSESPRGRRPVLVFVLWEYTNCPSFLAPTLCHGITDLDCAVPCCAACCVLQMTPTQVFWRLSGVVGCQSGLARVLMFTVVSCGVSCGISVVGQFHPAPPASVGVPYAAPSCSASRYAML